MYIPPAYQLEDLHDGFYKSVIWLKNDVSIKHGQNAQC